MDMKKLKKFEDWADVIGTEMDNTKVTVCQYKDNSKTRMNYDKDSHARDGLEFAKVIGRLGLIVLDNWAYAKYFFSEDVQNQVAKAVALPFGKNEPLDDNEK
ncbi:MAG: hypothetical protein RSC06_13535 [Clostridia bacterium]